MTIVTTYTQQDFDLLVSLGMPDTHYFDGEETQAVIEFTVSDIISKAYIEIKDIIFLTQQLTPIPLSDTV